MRLTSDFKKYRGKIRLDIVNVQIGYYLRVRLFFSQPLPALITAVLAVSPFLFAAFTADSASAATSRLNQIETSHTLDSGKIELTGGFGFRGVTGGGEFDAVFVRVSAGIFRGLQVNLDGALGDSDAPVGNWIYASGTAEIRGGWKYEIVEEGLERIGMAAGMEGIGAGGEPEYYLVFTKHATELFGFSAGLKGNTFGVEDSPRPFGGLTINFIPGAARVTADWQMNGSDELKCYIAGFGTAYKISESAELAVKWFSISGKGETFAEGRAQKDVIEFEITVSI